MLFRCFNSIGNVLFFVDVIFLLFAFFFFLLCMKLFAELEKEGLRDYIGPRLHLLLIRHC